MKNSFILRTLLNIYEKLLIYCKNSGFYRILLMVGQSFGKLAAGSGILRFFDREWNIESAWRRSLIFRILILPLRLLKYSSDRLSDGTNSTLEGSKALSGMRALLEDLFNINTRVYGLLFLTFAVTQGLLGIAFNYDGLIVDMGSIVRLILFLFGTMMILINRPVRSLVEGSIAGRIVYDFFVVSENVLSYTIGDSRMERTIKHKSYNITAVAAGVILGILGYFLPPMAFVQAVGAIVGLVLVLWRYEVGVFAVVGFIPLAPTMALLGLILLTAVSYGIRLFRDKSMKFRVNVLDYFVVLFGIVLFYSSITSYTPNNSMFALLIHIAYILFYFILVNTIKTRQQLYTIVALLVLSTTVTSLYGLYQLKTVGATSEAWVDTTLFEDIKARVGSTFENPNVLGEYLVMIIPLAAAMLWGQKSWLSRLLTLGLTAIMLVCLVYTYSRGAYIGLMLAFALFAVLRDKRFVILGIIGLLMLPFVLPPSVINRFTSIGNLTDTSSSYRISVWLGSLKLAKDYWPSGIGLGLEPFKLIYPKYSLNAAYAHHSHNIYIQLLIEMGISGFLMFAAMIVVYYKTLLAGFYRTKDRFTSTFMIAIASGMAGYLAQGIVENIWYNNRVLLTFWVMLAFGMIAKALITKDNEVVDI
ncbi:MAG: O-antigen ligase family protein [Clostridia bacterium]